MRQKQLAQPTRVNELAGAQLEISGIQNDSLSESAIIVNRGTMAQPMSGWALATLRGGQVYTFPSVPPTLQTALERLRAFGYVLFLATGRGYGSIELGSLSNLFAGIVWENGAVIYHTATEEIYLPFGSVDPRLKEALKASGVPLESGQAIVSTWTPHEKTVWRVLNEWGGESVVAYNKGAVMILPAGTSKGAGLGRLLGICGYSPRNLVAFGDGENDLSLLELGEFGVAVADAVSSLKAVADMVTTRPGPAGVLEGLKNARFKPVPCSMLS